MSEDVEEGGDADDAYQPDPEVDLNVFVVCEDVMQLLWSVGWSMYGKWHMDDKGARR